MKPYVVIIKQIKDGKVILTEEELKSIVERAYNDGYSDGSNRLWTYTPSITYCGNSGNSTPYTPQYINGTDSPFAEQYKVTCSTVGDKNEKT